MSSKRVTNESMFDFEALKKVNPAITPGVFEWWESLNQQQKAWYCEIHPNSDLTLGHLGQRAFDGWDQAQMQQYHRQQADALKLNLMGSVDIEAKDKLARIYHLQLRLAGL